MDIDKLTQLHNKLLDQRVNEKPFLNQRIKNNLKGPERTKLPFTRQVLKYSLGYGFLLVILTFINLINEVKSSDYKTFAYNEDNLHYIFNGIKNLKQSIIFDINQVSEISSFLIQPMNWRKLSYPLMVFIDDNLVWQGETQVQKKVQKISQKDNPTRVPQGEAQPG